MNTLIHTTCKHKNTSNRTLPLIAVQMMIDNHFTLSPSYHVKYIFQQRSNTKQFQVLLDSPVPSSIELRLQASILFSKFHQLISMDTGYRNHTSYYQKQVDRNSYMEIEISSVNVRICLMFMLMLQLAFAAIFI